MSIAGTLAFIAGHPLNRGQRLKAMARFVRWQVAQRLLPFPVAIPFVDGTMLLIERGMTGATGNFYCGLHEAQDMAFVLHLMRPGDVFYDVGANIGSYSLLAAAAGVTTIVAFEPSAATGRKLRSNTVLNGIEDRVVIHRVALGDKDGEISFSSGLDTTNHVLAPGESTVGCESTPLRRFDDFYSVGIPSFIKLDVEGFESAVLAGAANALKDPALMGILTEDNGEKVNCGDGRSVRELLCSSGFSVHSYDPWTRELVAGGSSRETGNLLFLRDAGMVAARVRAARRFRLINGDI